MPQQKKTVFKGFRLEVELVNSIEKMAVAENRNLTNMVETLLFKAVDKRCRCQKDL